VIVSRGGSQPSRFDGRDLEYSFPRSIVAPPEARLPHGVPLRNQGELPCCVSIAVTACMEVLDARHDVVVELSPLFHYFLARPDPFDLRPLETRAALKIASEHGICVRHLHDASYDAAGAQQDPSEEARRNARQHRLVGYDPGRRSMQYELLASERVNGCRTAIARGFPVLVAFWMTSAYHALTHANPVHARPTPEPSGDGHAVVAIGYDDARECLLIEDSRDTTFGSGGHWLLPYDLFDSRLVYEAWVLREITYDT
jgi:hypothetical protein